MLVISDLQNSDPIPVVRDDGARKIQGVACGIDDRLDDIRIFQFFFRPDELDRRCHQIIRIFTQRRHQTINDAVMDKRLITLNINDNIGRNISHGLRDTICAGGVIFGRQNCFCSERFSGF